MLQVLRRQGAHELAVLLRACAPANSSFGWATRGQEAHSRTSAEASTSASWYGTSHSLPWPPHRSFASASSTLLFKVPSDPDQQPEDSGAHTRQEAGAEGLPVKEDVTLAGRILQQVSVNTLVQRLESEAEERVVLPVAELYDLIKEHGITEDRDEAAKIVSALQTAGIILRYEGKIFIRTTEVAELVVRALPDTVQEAEGRVKELAAELAPLEVQRAQIERQASMWRGFVAWSGLAMLVTQFVLFARLTYWELSWDVMEPISYFAGQLVMIGCYMYFLLTNRDFGYEQHFDHVARRVRRRLMVRRHFDEARYAQLKQELARWQRYSRAIATRRA